MTEKILVTGGCGFIGSNVVERLVNEDFIVKIIDDLSSGRLAYVNHLLDNKENCTFSKGSITDYSFIEKEMKGIDIVIHEAANPDVRTSKESVFEDFEINVKGTINLLEAMAKNDVKKMIFASSGGTVYGETVVIPTPETHYLSPISHYGASKAASEQYLASYSSLYDMETISFRLGNIFGPPSNKGVMYDFYWKLKKNPEELKILGDGKQIKSYLYIDDCVDAHMQALNKTFKGHTPFNIASVEGITVNEIAENMVKTLGLKGVKFTYTGGERGWEGDVRKSIPDISKAEKQLGWKPQKTIVEGIKKYITWLQNQES